MLIHSIRRNTAPPIDALQLTALRRNKNWLPEYYFLGDEVWFESIGLALAVEDIYDRVDNADMNDFRQSLA